MNQFDNVLKLYSESGLRTAEDWTTLGREIVIGAKARLDARHRGAMVPLFSRDQTHLRVRARSLPGAPASSAVVPSIAEAPRIISAP